MGERAGRMSAAVGTLLSCVVGCTGDARVELTAADAIHAAAGSLHVALEEYDAEIEAFDEMRTRDVARALAVRLRKAAGDDEAVDAEVQRFLLAMTKLRGDRRIAAKRFAVAHENVALLQEVAEGLRRLAQNSMRLSDEGRRYLSAAVGQLQSRLSAWIRDKVEAPAD
ncbi:MAG: hypothetical protein ACE5E5_08550 [Phycisphaerae bacterium]